MFKSFWRLAWYDSDLAHHLVSVTTYHDVGVNYEWKRIFYKLYFRVR